MREALRIRCLNDVFLFARYFFPHYCRLPFSSLHRYIIHRYEKGITDDVLNRRGGNEVVAAPRGYAKSTLKTLILPVHSILYAQERYIVIISATLKQAKQRLQNIKSELINNALLKSVYSSELKARTVWTTKSINVNDIQVDVFSAGTELRGITYREVRPTLIIIDDGEDSEAVESPDQREKLMNWFNEVIENLGDTYTRVSVIGTVLHRESLLENMLHRPDFSARRFVAVKSFATHHTLWEQWRRLYTDLKDSNRMNTARAFYDQHKTAMNEGVKVLWRQKEDYYELMCQLTTRGRRAFFKEKQNEPRSVEHRIFDPDSFVYFSLDKGVIMVKNDREGASETTRARKVDVSELKMVGFLDSALGASGRSRTSDFAAIATVGVDRFGYYYLVDMWLERAVPTKQVRRIFELHERWNYSLFGIEANCFQSLLMLPIEEERKRLKGEGRIHWRLHVEPVTHRENKIARITRLEPFIANKWLLFNERLCAGFIDQCRDFPQSSHDDGLDALEGALGLASKLCPKPHTTIHSPRSSFPAMKNY